MIRSANSSPCRTEFTPSTKKINKSNFPRSYGWTITVTLFYPHILNRRISLEWREKRSTSTLTCEVLIKLNIYTISLYHFTDVIPLKLSCKFKFCLLLKASTNVFFHTAEQSTPFKTVSQYKCTILGFYQNKRISKRAKLLTVTPVQALCLHQGLKYKLLGARTLSS